MSLQLSPALRNRFTEIWCPLSHDADDYVAIIEHNIRLPADVTRNEDNRAVVQWCES